ncbi:hypothetical protein MtrunA17_Chr4g0062201 [Medicago truncatula]|uniref:Transmembrane protein n=1 Tax=Medicago truncatula TaxID=3880 RepID=A0A396IIX9_MEDTR|nr:hypothetical protein MtrunA17_Chr4g0062201 [Medicago truncatula]
MIASSKGTVRTHKKTYGERERERYRIERHSTHILLTLYFIHSSVSLFSFYFS